MARRLELYPEKAALLNKKVEQIRETIRYAMKKDGRPATVISRKAGMSAYTLNNMISGRWMSLKALILIAEELGLEIVIKEKEEPSREIVQEIIKDAKDRRDEAVKKAAECRISGKWNKESYWLGMRDAMQRILLFYGDES